jgi:hypothetical protein
MHISRKQALVALVAGVVPWVARRAHAAGGEAEPLGETLPTRTTSKMQAQIDALTQRVAKLEKLLASQVAFSKDAKGNLSLNAPAKVTLACGSSLSLKSGSTTNLHALGNLKIVGARIDLN